MDQYDFYINDICRRAGITESDQIDEGFKEFLSTINPSVSSALIRNFKHRHFIMALQEVSRLLDQNVDNPVKIVAQEYGLDDRVLQDYVRNSGILGVNKR